LLTFAVPQLGGTDEPFRPLLPERLATRTPDLEALVRGMYVRGLSTQDIGALYGEAFGETRLSKSTVSRITQQLTQTFDAWRRRDLSELLVVYVFLDGQHHAARQGTNERRGAHRLCAPRGWHAGLAARGCRAARIVRRVAQLFCRTWSPACCATRCW
jgi:hypothetical protein